MAKTYLDMVKYLIAADFNIEGLVDKPDIIGAVFGQTEGLLGDELDLRELQKNGKIGRIEIDISQSGSKTYGKLFLPASLDRVETCILAAAIESVDRVGPYDSNFKVEKVEDTRAEKRRKLLERAKELVRLLLATEIPDSKELSELVQSDVKTSEITSYGPERLPAGPEVAKNNKVILVEGRADVLNLLRNDITNVVAIGGATAIPKSIINLCNEKEVTVFLDGDRGADMILKTLLNVAEVDFVAKAPEGKEVEELTRKEVIKALRTKVPIDQYLGMARITRPQNYQQNRPVRTAELQREPRPAQEPRPPPQRPPTPAPASAPAPPPEEARYTPQKPEQQIETKDDVFNKGPLSMDEEEIGQLPKIESEYPAVGSQEQPEFALRSAPKPAIESSILAQLAGSLDELSGTLRSRLYNQEGSMIKELPIRELIAFLQDTRINNMYGVVLDGVITQRLVELALQRNLRAIYGLKANPMPKRHPELIIYTKEQGKLD